VAAAAALAAMPAWGETGVVDGNGRLVAMLYAGQDAQVRTDLVLPSPGWRRTVTLTSAEGVSVSRGEVSTWQGILPLEAAQRLEFKQAVREEGGRVLITLDYSALNDIQAEGLFFRINIPWHDFRGGTADNGLRSIELPETAPSNNNLLYGETAQLGARSAAGNVWWSARFGRVFPVNLQDKSNESPKAYTFWVYLHRGNLAAGTRGMAEVELAIDGVADTSSASLKLDTSAARSLFDGFGGNYCFQIESPVTQYTLENLNPRWARTEISMVEWAPTPEIEPAARDAEGTRLRREFELMRTLKERGIPFVASIWRLPEWALGDRGIKGPNDQQRRIDEERWPELLNALGAYLLYARDQYGVEPDLFSFNEPDIGVRILFSPEGHRDAIKRIGAHLESLGLKTKMLLGDVSHPRGTHAYTRPAAEDEEAMRHVGAVSFHSWGGATPAQYEAWAELAQSLALPLLVAELGTDPLGWRGRSYDSYWYGMEEARMYQEILKYARPQGTMYWEFTADYSLVRVTADGIEPTGRFWLTKHFTALTPARAEALAAESDHAKVLVSAFRKDSEYTVHIANVSAERNAALTGLPAEITAWRAFLTTEQEGFKELGAIEAADGGVLLTLPARSLLTLMYKPPPAEVGTQ
jgi:O-glycosyl hydrolase